MRAPFSAPRSSAARYRTSKRAPLAAVAASAGSRPASTSSSSAASRTVRAIGPAVSWLCEMGTIPLRLMKPTVGFTPTSEHADAGETTDPSVSVPTATAHRLDATATAEPELDPEGLRSSAYGFRHWPPRPLQPLEEWLPRKFAHS